MSEKHMKSAKKSHKKIWWSIGIVALILLIAGGVKAYTMYTSAQKVANQAYQKTKTPTTRNVSKVIKNKDPLNVLILGTDTGALGRKTKGLSDTMIVASLNAQKETTYMTSIPRDTAVTINNTTQKINAAYTIGGASQSIKTVQNLLDVPIDFYIVMNMGGLKELVNSVGGVDVTPTLTFKYGSANVKKGVKTHLTGKEALSYSRMRYDDPDGDYGRQKRQRQVILAVVRKALTISSVTRFQSILNSVQKNMKTNLTFNDMLALRFSYKNASHHIKSNTLEGENETIDGLSYQVASMTERRKISNKIRKELGLANTTKLTDSSSSSDTTTSSNTTQSSSSTTASSTSSSYSNASSSTNTFNQNSNTGSPTTGP
ncbi:LCP family protein [Pediococcus ethanolidurans]|uniref:LCP family glycopolymer transferase n=1 Tax=Pediococcus ethanolidurans TaxID=319653 RepID=UPI0021E89C50|nr:LCP family protein [Pediococcus ethanolidurans]MCV3326720.1 LCP family protein [Pediococcus ethanolidurans]